MDYILVDIAWINEEIINDNNSMIITLQNYFPQYLIEILNDKQNEYFVEYKQSNDEQLIIQPYNGYNIQCNNNKECKIIDLNVFNVVTPAFLIDQFGYGFILKTKNEKQMISFSSNNENNRFEWITHLDYAIHYKIFIKNNIKCVNINEMSYNNKLLNDFSIINTDSKQEYYTNYNFGLVLIIQLIQFMKH